MLNKIRKLKCFSGQEQRYTRVNLHIVSFENGWQASIPPFTSLIHVKRNSVSNSNKQVTNASLHCSINDEKCKFTNRKVKSITINPTTVLFATVNPSNISHFHHNWDAYEDIASGSLLFVPRVLGLCTQTTDTDWTDDIYITCTSVWFYWDAQ